MSFFHRAFGRALNCSIRNRSILITRHGLRYSARSSASVSAIAEKLTFRCVNPPLSARESSILQFTKNQTRNATHRDIRLRKRTSRFSGGGGGPGFIDSIPSGIIFWGIIVANGAVFLMWQFSRSQYEIGRDPSWVIAMNRHFLASVKNFREGRIWTILTSCFSQSDTGHLLVNAFTYFFMAQPVLAMLGNTQFLTLYLGGGILASGASMLWNTFFKNNPYHASHGASGAIYAIISFFACVSPTTKFLIFGIVPCPAWAFVTGIFIYDSLNALGNKGGQTDTAGHVGGLLAGMAYFAARRFGRM